MLNLLRSDFYKLYKAKYFWVCLLISIVLAIGTIFLVDFVYKIGGQQTVSQAEQNRQAMEENGVNVSAANVPGSYDELTASSQMVSFFTGETALILAVLISLFVGSEFNNGTIKTIASRNYTRIQIYASKLISSILSGILLTLICAALSTLTATVLWGFGDIAHGFWLTFFQSAALELLLLCAFISIFVMFSMLIRQNGGSLAANICFLEFVSLFAMLGEVIIKKVFGWNISLSNYLIDTNMAAISAGLTRTVVIRSLCVGVGFFMIALLIGLSDFQKRDIK